MIAVHGYPYETKRVSSLIDGRHASVSLVLSYQRVAQLLRSVNYGDVSGMTYHCMLNRLRIGTAVYAGMAARY